MKHRYKQYSSSARHELVKRPLPVRMGRNTFASRGHPIFSWKLTTFYFITICQFCNSVPIYFLLENWRPFLLLTITLIDFTWCRPLKGITPAPFCLSDLVCSLFFCKFTHINVFPLVSPLSGGCHPGRSARPLHWGQGRLLLSLSTVNAKAQD